MENTDREAHLPVAIEMRIARVTEILQNSFRLSCFLSLYSRTYAENHMGGKPCDMQCCCRKAVGNAGYQGIRDSIGVWAWDVEF